MVTITNGIKTLTVTTGAYESIYKFQGYICQKTEGAHNVAAPDVHSANADASEMSPDDAFVAELVEKPLSQWNKSEVRKYADIKGIDISGTRSINEARSIIQETLEA